MLLSFIWNLLVRYGFDALHPIILILASIEYGNGFLYIKDILVYT